MAEQQLHMMRSNLDDLPDLVVPEGYALRTYQPGDEAAWCAIMDTGIGSGWTVEECRAQLTGQDLFLPEGCFFITWNDEPVASACVWPTALYGPTSAQVHMVCAKPSHRGKGLGYLVTLALLHYMRDHEYASTYLGTDDFRIPAINAYLKLGFEPSYLDDSHRARWAEIFSETGQTNQWWRHARPEPASYQIREVSGNRALLVVLDSTQQEAYNRARRTILSVLYHLDIPYRLLDLADNREPSQALTTHQSVIFAQEKLGDSVSESLARQIVNAVCAGVGFISFDHCIDRYPESLITILPVTSAQAKHETQQVVVPASDHFIVHTHAPEKRHVLRQPIELMCVDPLENNQILMETEEQMSALVVGRVGEGRIVQYLVSPRIWDAAYYGHGSGLDDVFWKSIVWASRKPFVMKAMPSYVTFQVQAASGASDGFNWLRPVVERGWTPYIGVLTEEVHTDDWATMANISSANQVAWYPQGITEKRGLYYHHPRGQAYQDDELQARRAQAEEKFKQHGILIGQTFFPSFGEYGRNVVPLVLGAGAQYSLSSFLPNEAQQAGHIDWEPGPYGHPGFILDDLFGFPGLFVTIADPKPYERAPNRRFKITNTSAEQGYDHLKAGLSTSPAVDILDQVIDTAKSGLDARFYGAIILTEQDIISLAPDEWELVLNRIDSFISETGAIKMTQDEVGAYARSKVQTHLTHASYETSTDVLHVSFAGSTTVPLHLQIFDEHCRERVLAFDTFDERLEESIQLGEWISE